MPTDPLICKRPIIFHVHTVASSLFFSAEASDATILSTLDVSIEVPLDSIDYRLNLDAL